MLKRKKEITVMVDGKEITPNKTTLRRSMKKHKWLYVMLIPGLLYFILFRYVPMAGLVIAFKDYSPFLGLWESPWVGFKNFTDFFMTSGDFGRLLRNTLGISLLQLALQFPAPIILALLLNELRHQWYKRTIQTFVYIPHFVSWVIVASLTYQLFNSSDGLLTQLIQMSGGSAPRILESSGTFWGLIVGQDIWKETGYGTIIYLAALSGVDQEMYEAARVDGAGRWQMMWHITLPAIKSVIIIMLILRVGSILNTGYEQIFLMRNDLNIATSEVFDTYIYTRGIVQGQYSYTTAAGMFKSIVGMIMVLGANRIAKAAGESGIY
jgi:putative aldouronate transport system permease protein